MSEFFIDWMFVTLGVAIGVAMVALLRMAGDE